MNVVVVTLLSTLLIQAGYFMWKLSAEGQPKIGHASGAKVALALLSDWRWVLGFVFTTLGWVLFVQASWLGDISLVQPLMSAGDVLLVMMAVVFLHERLGGREWVCIAATVAGAATLSAHAGVAGPPTFDVLRLLVIVAGAAAAALALLWYSRHSARSEVSLALLVGLSFGCGSTLTKALAARAELAARPVLSWGTVLDPVLLAVVAANVLGLVLLQAAFQRGRAAVIVPVQLAVANAVTVLTGVVVFGEQVTAWRAVGIVLIVAGTGALHVITSRPTAPG